MSLFACSPLTPQNKLDRALQLLPIACIANPFFQGHTTPSQDLLISAHKYPCDVGHDHLCQQLKGKEFIFSDIFVIVVVRFFKRLLKSALSVPLSWIFTSGFVQRGLC